MGAAPGYVAAAALREFCTAVFQGLGLPGAEAFLVGACLVRANLRGLDSHGVPRIPIYAKRLRLGLVNPRPTLAVKAAAPAAVHVDGDDGMGMVVGTEAMAHAVRLARTTGVGLS
ncbi:MAG: Ldh family oxidoreductase [Candidatus Methylomirabilales bacterium]